ncbi:MAG UNVERIFIED_CONTAM: phage holin family protein [Anaerolineae bacterium]|jgi:putative membrane protein
MEREFMRNFLLTLFVNSVSIAVASWLLPGIHVAGGTADLVFVALVFGLVNAFLRPILTSPVHPVHCGDVGHLLLHFERVALDVRGQHNHP